jgi:hypothetical protein
MPTSHPLTDYVRASAQLLHLPLPAGQVQRVAQQLSRTQALAEGLMALELPASLECAELYCPAPFPSEGGEAGA